MTRIDQFESAFNAATRTLYNHTPIQIERPLVITDLDDEYQIDLFGKRVEGFLDVLGTDIEWNNTKKDDFSDVGELLELIETQKPDLVCTYRHLHSDAWKWPYSLGEYIDILTQVTDLPILVFPHPEKHELYETSITKTNTVMAMTSHLTGDDRLVSFAAGFTHEDGTLHLAHVEDQSAFERTIEIIGKIPEIDTDLARKTILQQLLKEPQDFIESCRQVLKKAGLPLTLKESITLGHHLSNYKTLLKEHDVDLLVLNTKDDDQLAMHGLAYPLAVELRDVPLLML